ncbi:hypothetical protein GCM10025876_13930 [Demequina litorisediminis]|uniref:Copper chaperone PCu(A)C n=1 Tax=Demequina litorisediminis TaxID=1849022 RepID=A0ABQ6IEN5_9MICO|nr:hypothetical protein GCM10025876_13930 [Demequina litorisediminis]
MFLNDGSGSKIGYYVATSVDVVDHVCADGSVAAQDVSVTLSHTFDGDVAAMPEYVSGGGTFVPAGEFHANLLVYPPQGLSLTEATQDGETAMLNGEIHHGRSLTSVRIVLAPGDTTTVEYRFDASGQSVARGDLAVTPGAASGNPEVDRSEASADC